MDKKRHITEPQKISCGGGARVHRATHHFMRPTRSETQVSPLALTNACMASAVEATEGNANGNLPIEAARITLRTTIQEVRNSTKRMIATVLPVLVAPSFSPLVQL